MSLIINDLYDHHKPKTKENEMKEHNCKGVIERDFVIV